jgi:tRNA pseudouridine55 synthase
VTASGLLVVDKPAGLTSHDVVGRVRRLAGTRRVGHAGTLDPMATGVLVVGVEKATRLLGHLTTHTKRYQATARLGATTSTDDREGEVLTTADPSALDPAVLDEAAVRAAFAAQVGELDQVPPALSAVKVDGRRAYARARAGEDVTLTARRVIIHALDVLDVRPGDGHVDVDLDVTCSAGTYIRAIARDAGAALGVGGHLTALRRTASGPYLVADAVELDALDVARDLVPVAEAAGAAFPRLDVDDAGARAVGFGQPLAPTGIPGVVAVFGPDGALLALVEDREDRAAYLAVLA